MTTAVQSLSDLRPAWPHPRHWASTVVLGTAILLYLFAGLSVASTGLGGDGAVARAFLPSAAAKSAGLPREAPPVPEPLSFREMTTQDAAAYNASIPISDESNPAAKPFAFAAAGEFDRSRALDCLTAAVYYEAAIEPLEGQRAVAQVVLNRVRHPAFPKSVCGVVFQGSERSTGCQFTFTCDGSLGRTPSVAGWERARKVAEEALAGKVYKPVGYATHYHTNWVVPYWSASLTKLANVGTHIFYRWEGGWGRPPAFRYRATGSEPAIARLGHGPSAPGEMAEVDPAAAAAALAAAGTPLPQDMQNRPVVRRYEPLRAESVAKARAELASADVPQSLRWALTGESTAPVAGPLTGVRRKTAEGEPQAPAAAPVAGVAAAKTME